MKTIKFKQWNCKLKFAKYGNDRTAILLLDAEDGERVAVATVNIPDEELLENEVIIKDYSENEGMLEVLIEAGIVKDTNKMVQAGRVMVSIVELLIPINENDV